MTSLQEELTATLNWVAARLRETDLPSELANRMEELAKQVDRPCVVAVVGQARVGKSTFVNALLAGEFARVGTTETTATIIYFSHGKPPDTDRPVRCHWRDGKTTWEGRAFLDGLQGNDLGTLRRADGIDHLEYFLEHPFLEQLTLVDTPNFRPSIKPYQDRAAELMELPDQSLERRNEDAYRIVRETDAVIYLIGAPVARHTNQAFLEEFRDTTGGRFNGLNAVGVMSKIELYPEVLARRRELSEEIAKRLRDALYTVTPVAAGVCRALNGLLADKRAGLRRLIETLRNIPSEILTRMLEREEGFLEREYDGCPVSAVERRALFEELPEDVRQWPVFLTIVRAAADPDLDFDADEVEARLEEISNFEALKETLNRRFVERGHILRCFRIVADAREVLNEIKFAYLPRYRMSQRPNINELEKLHQDLDKELDELYWELGQHDADLEALQKLEEPNHDFTEDELNELQPLLGLYGSEVEKRLRISPGDEADPGYARERQLHWKGKMEQAPFGSTRQMVAERAYTRYGIIWDELKTGGRGRSGGRVTDPIKQAWKK